MSDNQVVNCHTHIFTADHVPPRLGRSLVPWPFYLILNINWLIAIVRSVRDKKGVLRRIFYRIKTIVDSIVFNWQRRTGHHTLSIILSWLIQGLAAFACIVVLAGCLRPFLDDKNGRTIRIINAVLRFPPAKAIDSLPFALKLIILLLGIIFFKTVRNLTKAILLATLGFLKNIMGSGSLQLLKRYYNIAVLCEYKEQAEIFNVLKNSYPADTKFVVLPMDLDFIKAGTPREPYMVQLQQLMALKKEETLHRNLLPFVFADPRRFQQDPGYYDTVINCLENGFAGIKIYPALGYYPFDENLLKLYYYACQHEIPITTHCIRGVIFYRGTKKTEWDFHPIFTGSKGSPLELREFKNIDFINNFTHPLNYLCLLDPNLFKKVLHRLPADTVLTKELYELYGFEKAGNPGDSTLRTNLSKLKINFGHFGGEDEWAKYIERDTSQLENKFTIDPSFSSLSCSSAENIWRGESWYSIVRSIIMNKDYPNVFADISFIIYDPNIISLLRSSLAVPHLQNRILYGTDFYVVRQNGNDKKFWLDIQAHLTPAEMKLIAVDNPAAFLRIIP